MPNSRQAAKRMRQNEARRIHNRAISSRMRTQLKRFFEAINSGDVQTAENELPAAMKRIDKAAKNRVIHPNKASRKKSQLSKALNEAKASASS